jgi:hypothetical protein
MPLIPLVEEGGGIKLKKYYKGNINNIKYNINGGKPFDTYTNSGCCRTAWKKFKKNLYFVNSFNAL